MSRWLIVGLALLEGGWMAFDGARALILGDYVTPQSGPFAGRLGPWAQIASTIGIEPRSTLMKAIFAGYGSVWLVVIAMFAATKADWTVWAMLALAIGALWYAPVGTLFSIVQIVLLANLIRSRA